jgi:hypothetical protein
VIASLLALSLALPPSGQVTSVEIVAAIQLDVRSLNAAVRSVPRSGEWLGGDGTFGVTVFGRRALDDEAAPPLQPFLQRVPRFHIEGGGGGASIHYPIVILALYPNTAQDLAGGHAATWADGYIGRWVYLAASLGINYQSWGRGELNPGMQTLSSVYRLNLSELTVSASAAAGVRWRDLLFSAGWGVAPYRLGADAMQVRFWGGAFVAVRAVVRGFVDLAARVQVIELGAIAEASATAWLRRRLGLTAGLEGGHGAFFDSPVVYDRAGGHVGVAWWFAPRLAASLTYAPAWQRASPVAGLGTAMAEISLVAHLLTFTVTSRPPFRGTAR